MLEQAHSLLLDKLVDHVAEYRANSIEALVRLADVRKTNVIQEDLLYDEDRNGLAELGTRLHDAQAERYDFGGQEEVDDFGRIVLYECADNAERCQAKILERSRLGCRVQEGIEEEWNVRCHSVSQDIQGSITCDVPLKNRPRVSACEATHWSSASALQTRFDAAAVNCDGLSSG